MCPVIAMFIMNLPCIARVNPDLPCTILFDDGEWKVLYCAANRTKEAPEEPCAIKEAAGHTGNLGVPSRALGDGSPCVKTVWRGLQKFHTLYGYREMSGFVGQV